MRTPEKPFDEYKWRWATATPTEGLDEPQVFLGVLRALEKSQGLRPNDELLIARLQRVQDETGTAVNLARTAERNLMRNSQQYWKALGLLDSTQPIQLTALGQAVATGRLSVGDFAAAVVRTLALPNVHIESPEIIDEWEAAGLRIKPLELIIEIIQALETSYGSENAYLETQELIRLVIPLAGDHGTVDEHVAAIGSYRRDGVLPDWPDCCPEANDKRWAREFLLFLWHYGYCRKDPGHDRDSERYYLAEENVVELESLLDLPVAEEATTEEVAAAVRGAGDVAIPAERRKVTREVTERPGQAKFRRDVLAAYGNSCALTGETLDAVLEACHIQPANEGGPDVAANGICLRADLHKLFDKGYILIDMSGHVLMAEELATSPSYSALPTRIGLVAEDMAEYLGWRERYGG